MSVRWVGGAQWLHQRSYLLLVLTRLMKAVRLNQNSKVAGKKTENLSDPFHMLSHFYHCSSSNIN